MRSTFHNYRMIHIGIDPGLTGAVAFIPDGREPFVVDIPTLQISATATVKRALDSHALARLIENNIAGFDFSAATVYLERVSAFPGQGVSSMFSLGMSYWGAFSVAAALRLPIKLIEPKDWKRHFRLDKDKELARALAQRLFPNADLGLKKHHGRAEALLIAQYGKSTSEGK